MFKFKRKLYTRGSSFETTIPMPILFSINKEKKHDVIFAYDEEKKRWYIDIEAHGEQAHKDTEDKSSGEERIKNEN